jgi:hypothetical protein
MVVPFWFDATTVRKLEKVTYLLINLQIFQQFTFDVSTTTAFSEIIPVPKVSLSVSPVVTDSKVVVATVVSVQVCLPKDEKSSWPSMLYLSRTTTVNKRLIQGQFVGWYMDMQCMFMQSIVVSMVFYVQKRTGSFYWNIDCTCLCAVA